MIDPFRESVEQALARYDAVPLNDDDAEQTALYRLVDDLRVALDTKHCSCGKTYTRAEFMALEKPTRGDRQGDLILRQCACKSTLAMGATP